MTDPRATRERELAADWVLLAGDREVARLSNMRVPDQFWREFDFAVLTDDPALVAPMRDEAFWDRPDLALRSELTGHVRRLDAGLPIFGLGTARRAFAEGVVAIRGL